MSTFLKAWGLVNAHAEIATIMLVRYMKLVSIVQVL